MVVGRSRAVPECDQMQQPGSLSATSHVWLGWQRLTVGQFPPKTELGHVKPTASHRSPDLASSQGTHPAPPAHPWHDDGGFLALHIRGVAPQNEAGMGRAEMLVTGYAHAPGVYVQTRPSVGL